MAHLLCGLGLSMAGAGCQESGCQDLRVFVLHPGIAPFTNDPEWFKRACAQMGSIFSVGVLPGYNAKPFRTRYFYLATLNTPAMVLKMVGVGSQYALLARDGKHQYLDGGEFRVVRSVCGRNQQLSW